jgi:hypothetical protein
MPWHGFGVKEHESAAVCKALPDGFRNLNWISVYFPAVAIGHTATVQ